MSGKYDNSFYTPEELIDTAKALMRFIDTRRQEGVRGVRWSLRDGLIYHDNYYDEICMYAGASGIICFLLSLYDVTGKREYLEEAGEAARYLEWRWDNDRVLKRNFSQYAFSSGWSGVGYALLQYRRVTGDSRAEETVHSIIRQTMEDAVPVPGGEGCGWSDYPGIVGDAGTILFLLYAAGQLGVDEYRQFAVRAGRAYLGRARDAGDGKRYYLGVDPEYFGAGDDYVDPNFPMGTAGIGFMLLRLYEESGDRDFLEAVNGVHEYIASVAVPVPGDPDVYAGYAPGSGAVEEEPVADGAWTAKPGGDCMEDYGQAPVNKASISPGADALKNAKKNWKTRPVSTAVSISAGKDDAGGEVLRGGRRFARLLPHGLPKNPDLFYLGYCHGPAGTCRFYYKLWKMTGDPLYHEWIDRLVHGLLDTGAPEKRSPGYWNTYNICCGTAGLLNLFLGLWADNGDPDALDAAKRCGRVLMDAVKYEEDEETDAASAPVIKSASIAFALDRVAPQAITTPIGLFDGAAGIGAMLLQLALALRGDFHTARAVDDPFPAVRK